MEVKSGNFHAEIPQQKTIFQTPAAVDPGAHDNMVDAPAEIFHLKEVQRMVEPEEITPFQPLTVAGSVMAW